MQRSQSKILRAVANAPWYVTNHNLHTDFNITYVSDAIHERINKHHNNLEAHPIPLLEPLLHPESIKITTTWKPIPFTIRATTAPRINENHNNLEAHPIPLLEPLLHPESIKITTTWKPIPFHY